MAKYGSIFVLLLILAITFQPAKAGGIPKKMGISVIPITEYLQPFGAVVLLNEKDGEPLYSVKITVFNHSSRNCIMIDWLDTEISPTHEKFLRHVNHWWRKAFPATKSHLAVYAQFPEPATKLKMLMSLEAVPLKQ
ncbi:MAG: hypothetical protein U9O20_00830 [Patescibacteria group bacterium]|nr:hypothetical protein [Patescibacteria group bacterium]